MARTDRTPEPFPCPYGCGTQVPGDARYCPQCAQQVVEFCSNCGRRLRRPRGWTACPGCGAMPNADVSVTGGVATVKARRCSRCSQEVPVGLATCPHCRYYLPKFQRLCPFCKRRVDMKANSCQHCGKHFPLSVERRLSHVVCVGCKRSSELDDWVADLNIPSLFQTERGVKLAWFQSLATPPAETWQYYFQPLESNLRLGEIARRLEASDEGPWSFPTQRKAIEFLNNYPCVCGAQNWRMSVLHAVQKLAAQAGPPALDLTRKAGTWGWGVLRGASGELKELFKKKK